MDERIVTYYNRLDYFLLNGGSDNAALPEDSIPETVRSVINLSPHIHSFGIPSSEILPSKSISRAVDEWRHNKASDGTQVK